jgi:hypothetical protein
MRMLCWETEATRTEKEKEEENGTKWNGRIDSFESSAIRQRLDHNN